MDALVMCGGQGSRLDAETEKPLYSIAGRPMVERVVSALGASRVDTIRAVASPNAPRTRETVAKRVDVLDAPGEGYVADLQYALERVERPVLTVAADLPLLNGPTIDGVLDAYDEAVADGGPAIDATICVPRVLPERLGACVEADAAVDGDTETAAVVTGVNVVGADETAPSKALVLEDPRLAINVNRLADASLAEEILTSERITDATAEPATGGERR